MVEEEEQKKEEKEFKLVEVPTETGLAIETPEGKIISESQLLVLIVNRLVKLEKALVG